VKWTIGYVFLFHADIRHRRKSKKFQGGNASVLKLEVGHNEEVE
jgi:hypothetical protein